MVAAARTPEATDPPLGYRDRRLMTTVVNRSELAGKAVKAVVVLTGDPENALLRAVRAIEAEEFLIGPSAAEPPDCPIDHLVARWTAEANGQPARLTIRRVARDRDERRDLQGGS